MSDESVNQTPPTVFSSKERAALVARALSEAARRARFSTKRRRSQTAGGLRARRGVRLFSVVRLVSFVAVVAVPCVVFGIYIFFIASSQYAAEARFTVSSGLPIGTDALGAMTGIPSEMIIQDTQVILNYIDSPAIVEALQKTIGVKSYFERSDIDRFSRLHSGDSIEKVFKYWKAHLQTKISLPGGIVTFSVRAFTPEDSVKITTAALDASEELINRMNDQIRTDAVSVADVERQRAEARLAETQTNLERARNEEGTLSADATSKGYDTLLALVKSQELSLEESYDSQRKFVGVDAPQLRTLQSRIDAAKQQVEKIQAMLTTATEGTPDPDAKHVLSGSMTKLDYAMLENEIAEKIYTASKISVEEAHIASELKLMYINRFIEPAPPQRSTYPKRPLDFVLLALACVALWGTIVGATKFAVDKLL